MSATVPTGAPQKVFVRARRQISAPQAILNPATTARAVAARHKAIDARFIRSLRSADAYLISGGASRNRGCPLDHILSNTINSTIGFRYLYRQVRQSQDRDPPIGVIRAHRWWVWARNRHSADPRL